MYNKLIVAFLTVAVIGCGSKNKNEDEDTTTDITDDTVADTTDDTGADTTDDTGADTTDDTAVDDTTDDTVTDVMDDDVAMDMVADGDDAVDMTGDDGSVESLRFENIVCLPDIIGGDDWVEGQSVTCSFEVHGAAGRSASVSCEDTSGTVVDCSSMSSTQIQPFGANPLPIESGWFGAPSAGLAGTTYEIVWVADDGTDQARYTLSGDVIADDGVDGDPSIEVDCGGDTDGDVDVTAGDRLDCVLMFLDPDPDSIWWDYWQTSGATPVSTPGPYGGLGGAPYSVDWAWNTDSSETGGTWVWTFEADDETDPVVTYDLTVHVL